jgi:F-type H+-transporting ATPase subunit epsilon
MKLEILLPSRVFLELDGVLRVVARTAAGSYGLLPHRLDGVAALVPGILCLETEAAGEVFVAVDEGVLVKTGETVSVSVRRAIQGADLAGLHATVEREFVAQDEAARAMREVLAKLESGFVARIGRLQGPAP